MAAIYTTVEIVKNGFKFIDTNFISDSMITIFIEMAQGQIDCLIKTSHLTDFVMPKHAILQQLCTALVVAECVSCSPDSFYSSEDRNSTLEIKWNIIKIDMKLLSDPARVILLS